MIIKRPVYLVEIVGDVEAYALQVPTTAFAVYEKDADRTYIIVNATKTSYKFFVRRQYERIHRGILENQRITNQEQMFITHHPDGLEFH